MTLHDEPICHVSSMMTAEQLLDQAASVKRDYRREYGEPVQVFEAIAQRWSLLFRVDVTALQVVLALLDVKLVRLSRIPMHLDSITDIAGYAGLLAELKHDA